MSLFEQLFASSQLDVIVPDASLHFPSQDTADGWLEQLKAGPAERKQAFFDEQLQFLLMLRVNHPTHDATTQPDRPPADLLNFLTHLQVSLEATYISSVPTAAPNSPSSARLSAPPRSDSMGKVKARGAHPSIFPPHTPNPMPSTAENDRKYTKSEGTLLVASIWGQTTSEDSQEAFTLFWSENEHTWIAVYKLSASVSFLRLQVSDPLLCLTVSVTLREKPLAMDQSTHPLAAFLTSIGGLPSTIDTISPISATVKPDDDDTDNELAGFQEINLLEGLSAGPTFPAHGPHGVSLPSTRLGPKSRRELFSLQPVSPSPHPTPTPTTASHPTLRKSFRKTLETVSGFRVRMRTVFVPRILFPGDQDEDPEERKAGDTERTVVLCVEVENAGEAGPGVGFLVESVDVRVGGEGAEARLIGWGEQKEVFPLRIGSMEQYNLLYAVSFLHSPDDSLAVLDLNGSGGGVDADLQRAVTISINGKPFKSTMTDDLAYQAHTFSSRWNCVLDLSVPQHQPKPDPIDFGDYTLREALPEPASPFPMSSPHTAVATATNTPHAPSPVAGSKRHTLPANTVANRALRASVPVLPHPRASTASLMNPTAQPPLGTPGPGRLSYTPPSIAVQSYVRSPTTYGPPPPGSAAGLTTSSSDTSAYVPPPTPAYPAYPPSSTLPPTPHAQAPLASQQMGSVGPSVEIRREKGAGVGGVPQTPGPTVVGGAAFAEQQEVSGEPIVVSVGLLRSERNEEEGDMANAEKIYPLDEFTLDIFVFNKSSWTRRFEVSYPDRRRRRRERGVEDDGYSRQGDDAMLPLDNRVRVGPLLPSTCQSVRMQFLALKPGVHSIDTLTLTDIETGFSVNLRSVMDIVVHEPNDE